VQRVLVASPGYLTRYGRPKTPSDLSAHRCIASTAITASNVWTFGAGGNAKWAKSVRINPRLSINSAEAAIRSAVSGVGVTSALSYQVAEQLASGALIRLLASHEPPPLPVHLVYPASSAQTAKVRSFVELAAPRLRALLAGASQRRR
jgi:DNA-binding transcriptional LysR family regulator